ncbi:DUF342 domain-containing protein [Dissulfurirhabdus thermomarina]|uniref:DUF342 domain-containing protein n=1 Tax=Dissulfurirhabdus thermomarina TaxID=1765737 RepID=A0A6N9TXQ3_DISTH|nr:FapA family protein [Dissulfurirhabdus thermomarina]NDY43256.1 DUF342 domain-containing protein [Dissulfurirhabdus thermomarina]NMX23125.1 DUF342 domain-containing protein [Dissulfurirhabdus thermomarina]
MRDHADDPRALRVQLETEGISAFDGRFRLVVRDRGMALHLVPEQGWEHADLPDIGDIFTTLSGLGLDAELFSTPRRRGDGWILAEGVPPLDGADGRLEILAEDPAPPGTAANGPAERTDWREPSDLIRNVLQDQPVAVLRKPSPGYAGKNVFGEPIPARAGRPAKVRLGDGVAAEEDEEGVRVRAARDGHLAWNGSVLSVADVFTVPGDVDYATGNLMFVGRRLEIGGDVLPGFRVQCRGDVHVKGLVNDGTVEAVGDVHVDGGVIGEKAEVRAGGDIRVGFAENARLDAGQDLYVRDHLLQVDCFCRGRLVVVEGKGAIVGGSSLALRGVEAQVIGSAAAVPTLVHVGYDPKAEETKEHLKDELDGWKLRLMKVKRKIRELRERNGGAGALEKAERIEAMVQQAIREAEARMDTLNQHFSRCRKARVVIRREVFPNIQVGIYNAWDVNKVHRSGPCEFFLDDAARVALSAGGEVRPLDG